MVKLSIVYVARDDKYGDDYNCVEFEGSRGSKEFYAKYIIKYNNIQRIKFTLENNIKLLERYFPDAYEIIFVDWNPINNNFLHINNELKEILSHKNIKNIIVARESIYKYVLNVNGFYEYYGKNVGIRNCTGNYILVSNPDDVITDNLMFNIKVLLDDNYIKSDQYYRCYSRLDVDHELNVIAEGLSFGTPDNKIFADYYLGTPASGDFLLTSKDILMNVRGYDENFISSGNQTMLDGKLCYKLHYSNIKPNCIQGSIMHLDHKKHNRSGFPPNWTNDYTNNANWGFMNYNIIKLENNVYKI